MWILDPTVKGLKRPCGFDMLHTKEYLNALYFLCMCEPHVEIRTIYRNWYTPTTWLPGIEQFFKLGDKHLYAVSIARPNHPSSPFSFYVCMYFAGVGERACIKPGLVWGTIFCVFALF